MLRWSILLVTLSAWLFCMRLVYVRFSPQVSHNAVTSNTTALDNLFDENGEAAMSWDVYVRPSELNDARALPFAGLTGTNSSPVPAPAPTPETKSPHVDWNG